MVQKTSSKSMRDRLFPYNDTFSEYEEPYIAISATKLLESAGYEVILEAKRSCCGRPLISKGFLQQAKENARRT